MMSARLNTAIEQYVPIDVITMAFHNGRKSIVGSSGIYSGPSVLSLKECNSVS